MSSEQPFDEILDRLRAGDPEAVDRVVRSMEPRVRSAIRSPLDRMKLRRLMDSSDISQAVLAAFFRRLDEGATFDLADEDQLARLLVSMARNKLRDELRRQMTDRRGAGAYGDLTDHCLDGLRSDEPTPSHIVGTREVADALFARLPDEVRYLAQQRAEGREWADLAAEQGGTAQSLRKKMARAARKAAEGLILDGPE